MKKVYTTKDGKISFTRSRWANVKTAYTVGKNNSLYDFATDENGYKSTQEQFNPENGVYLDYFIHKGRKYAIEQFIALGSVWCGGVPYEIIENDGKSTFIHAVDFYGDLYNTLYIELDECGERVRVYEEVRQ